MICRSVGVKGPSRTRRPSRIAFQNSRVIRKDSHEVRDEANRLFYFFQHAPGGFWCGCYGQWCKQRFGDGAHVSFVLSWSAVALADQNDRMFRELSGCGVPSDSIYSRIE